MKSKPFVDSCEQYFLVKTFCPGAIFSRHRKLRLRCKYRPLARDHPSAQPTKSFIWSDQTLRSAGVDSTGGWTVNALATHAPTFIPVCCVCGLAREEGDSAGCTEESWSDFDAYLSRHGLRGTDYKLTHAYCPLCVQQYVVPKKRVAEPNRPVYERADITMAILKVIRRVKQYDLDELASACPPFTWNQIFLEVDRLSRTGDLHLTLSERGHYAVSLRQ